MPQQKDCFIMDYKKEDGIQSLSSKANSLKRYDTTYWKYLKCREIRVLSQMNK